MATIAEIRGKYPQYADMSDEQLAGALHKKYYSDIPYDDYAGRIGLAPAPAIGQEPEASPSRMFPSSFRELGEDIRGIPRQLGLTARYGLEAFGQTALPDVIGLPSPQTPTERVIGGTSRMLVQAGGIAKGAQLASAGLTGAAKGITGTLAANTGTQASGAIGAGIAGESVREAGGGPTEQFAASVVGGLGGAAATRGVDAAFQSAKQAGQRFLSTKDVQGEVKLLLERSGVDWNSLSVRARADLVKDAEKLVYSGQPVDAAALRRLADYRAIGAKPTVGDITQDPRNVTLQRNLAKQQANTSATAAGPDLAQIENANAKTVLSTLENVADSPLDAYATGAAVQGRIQAKDAAMRNAERTLYGNARDSSGRQIPLDRSAFVNQAMDNLEQSNRNGWLPEQVRGLLNDISSGKAPFNVDTIDAFKTLLAQESRATSNGNTRAALSAVRSALDDIQPALPKVGGTQVVTAATGQRMQGIESAADDSLKSFDKARRFAKARRDWQESSRVVESALDDGQPDAFVKKYIISGTVDDLSAVRKEAGKNPEIRQAIRKQLVSHIMERGRADSDTVKFSSAGMNDALKAIGDRKLSMFFSAAEVKQIKAAVNVARYMQSQPIGSAVNNSNSAAMIMGRLFDSLLSGAQKTPLLGPMVADPIRGAVIGMQARQVASPANALALPTARAPYPSNQLLALAALNSGDQ